MDYGGEYITSYYVGQIPADAVSDPFTFFSSFNREIIFLCRVRFMRTILGCPMKDITRLI